MNGNILALVKQRYRLSSKDMRRILNANYVTYKNAEQKNNYINIKKQTTSCPYEAEIVKKWKKKDNITYKSIFSMKQKYHLTLEEIRSILNISKTDFNALITRKKKKVKIQLYTKQDKQMYANKVQNQKKYKVSKKTIERNSGRRKNKCI